jgi:hypothetical protein
MIFPKIRGGEISCVVQIRPVSNGISGRWRGILRLPGELACGAGVWNALRTSSSILVHGFLNPSSRPIYPLHKKPVFGTR